MLLADDEDQLGQRQEKGVGFITEHATKEKEQEMGRGGNNETMKGKFKAPPFELFLFLPLGFPTESRTEPNRVVVYTVHRQIRL